MQIMSEAVPLLLDRIYIFSLAPLISYCKIPHDAEKPTCFYEVITSPRTMWYPFS